MSINPPIQPTQQQKVPPDWRVLFDALGMEFGKQINCARPGIIQSFDPSTCTASIQIAQQQVTSIQPDGTETLAPFAPLEKVPVAFPGGGGFTLTFPVAAGDECILLFNDREIDNWYLTGQVAAPTSPRLHDFSDAVALVGLRSKPRALGGISATTTQLRSDDGTTYVEIAAGSLVNVVAPTEINLTSPIVNIAGVINVQNTGGAPTPCNVSGSIVATGDVKSAAGAHSLSTHVHGGVTPGGGDTGGPIG